MSPAVTLDNVSELFYPFVLNKVTLLLWQICVGFYFLSLNKRPRTLRCLTQTPSLVTSEGIKKQK